MKRKLMLVLGGVIIYVSAAGLPWGNYLALTVGVIIMVLSS